MRKTKKMPGAQHVQSVVDPIAQLGLRVELLKRTTAGDHAISQLFGILGLRLKVDPGGHDQYAASEPPCRPQGLHSLLWVLDHIHHVPKVHNLGGAEVTIWPMRRIPSTTVMAETGEDPNVVATTAPIIQQSDVFVDQP